MTTETGQPRSWSLGAGARVGPGVSIGAGSSVGENAVILGPATIGARVRIGPGAVIGAEGFGYERDGDGWRHLEHGGPVVVEDDVELGANVTVARAKTGRETRIGQGTKVDAQVHIAHNVVIGRDCVIAAQTGIAGSAVIGNRVRIGGQVGISDHVRVGDDATILARAAVFRSVPAGESYSGVPARPHRETTRLWAWLHRRFLRGD
ncbi:MAG: UDP-3-O-(3-hydroxymyristoyl)glucosamine N-acyltransferase [bacterium]